MKSSLHHAAMRGFRGWDRVSEYYDLLSARWHMKLELDGDWFLNDDDLEDSIDRLMAGSDAWKLVEMVKSQRKRLGLRRYCRRRR